MSAAAPLLLPPPKRIRLLGGIHAGNRPRSAIADIGRKEPDAYRLTISAASILIESSHKTGLFYGRQTLAQLRNQFPAGLPCLRILDWPDFPVRGFYHDVSRGKVPKLKTLLALADKCAHYKINQLQLYIEHTYAFQRHPEVWQGTDPLKSDEIQALDAHCEKLSIDLVPSFSTFGHLYGWIHTEKFQHLNELERDVSKEPFNWRDRMRHYTLDCRNPESIELVRGIIQEVRPLFRSKYFNICADETFDLGKGKNRALAKKLGAGRLYVDFLKQIMEAVRENGAVPMFWGDIIGKHPELIGEIPSDAVALAWDYGAKPESRQAVLMEKSGLVYYVCPGVSGWNRPMNDYRTAHRNITRSARQGKMRGASGLLNTDWGDFGHINALGLSLPGLILGASVSWNTNSSALTERRSEEAISKYEFGDGSGRLLGMMRAASSCGHDWQGIAFWQQPRSKDMPREEFHAASGIPHCLLSDGRGHAKALRKILQLLPQIERILSESAPLDPLVIEEIRTGLLGLRLKEEVCLVLCARLGRTRITPPKSEEVAMRLLAFEARLHREWLARNKPSEYVRVREVLHGVVKDLLCS